MSFTNEELMVIAGLKYTFGREAALTKACIENITVKWKDFSNSLQLEIKKEVSKYIKNNEADEELAVWNTVLALREFSVSTDNYMEVINILQQFCPEKEIYWGTHLKTDLGLDSLDIIEVALDLEERFDIEIPDGELSKFKEYTVEELLNSCRRYI